MNKIRLPIKLILTTALMFIQLCSILAQDLEKQTCYDNLMMTDEDGNYLINANSTATNVVSGLTSLTGLILGFTTSPLMVIPAAVEGVNLSYLITKKTPIKRLRSIIYLSLKKVSSPDIESEKLLKKTVEKINKESTKQISELEFATIIAEANEDRKLCSCDRLTSLQEIRKEIVRTGSLEDVEKNYKVPSLRKEKLY